MVGDNLAQPQHSGTHLHKYYVTTPPEMSRECPTPATWSAKRHPECKASNAQSPASGCLPLPWFATAKGHTPRTNKKPHSPQPCDVAIAKARMMFRQCLARNHTPATASSNTPATASSNNPHQPIYHGPFGSSITTRRSTLIWSLDFPPSSPLPGISDIARITRSSSSGHTNKCRARKSSTSIS
jgi:hypothetical protein